ncbi:MAG: hypothetical protein AAGU17_13675, partial [Anaerolineaceae bacterium]
DLIYEHHSAEDDRVRIAVIQYKVWEGIDPHFTESVIKGFEHQIAKMRKAFCVGNFCSPRSQAQYRLPCCTAFFRPTNRLQSASASFVSTGYHVPICVLDRIWVVMDAGKRSLHVKDTDGQSLKPDVFEKLFNANMLGSRWLERDDLKKLYLDNEIADAYDRIFIYAQDFSTELAIPEPLLSLN